MFIDGLQEYLDETRPGGLEAIGAQIAEDEPTFVTMDHPTWYDWATALLDAEYVELGTTQLVTWYAHRSLGAERLGRARGDRAPAGPPPM